MTQEEALTRIKTGNFNNGCGFDMQLLFNTVGIIGEMFKSRQILPVKHGRWMESKIGDIKCSECGTFALKAVTGCLVNRHYEPMRSEYCPHCGAKMNWEAEDELQKLCNMTASNTKKDGTMPY